MTRVDSTFKSVCKAVQILSAKCDNICIPIKNGNNYDLIVDAKGIISRIKVIRTDCISETGSFIVNLRKSGNEPFSRQNCEFIFVACPVGNYLIPCSEITQKRAIHLTKFEKYLVV